MDQNFGAFLSSGPNTITITKGTKTTTYREYCLDVTNNMKRGPDGTQCDPEASPCCKHQDVTMLAYVYLKPGEQKEGRARQGAREGGKETGKGWKEVEGKTEEGEEGLREGGR